MEIIKVNLKSRSYKIIVGSGILKNLSKHIAELRMGTDAYVITNAAIKNKYGSTLNKILKNSGYRSRFKLIPDTERAKSLAISSGVINDIASYDKGREIFILALGGGVIGDLSGFVAAIYKRGVPYIQVPTTLLAQVDSAIGGKTAVDLSEGKNLVGAFYQPRLVFSDVRLLNTLGLRQIRCGLAEVIKYGVIKDKELFAYIEKNYKGILNKKQAALEHIVRRSSRIKAAIVAQDEKEEKGIRTILNFGHTIGHAIEAAANFKRYNHGEAIAIGMLAASQISKNLKLIDNKVYLRIEKLIKAVGLPCRIKNIPLQRVIRAHYRDKKFIGRSNRFVLITGIGKTKIVENIPLEIIKGALKKRI